MHNRTLGSQLSGPNGLDTIRLILASTVFVAHSWGFTGHSPDPSIGDTDLGSLAVAGFFAISGYLIAGSRLSLSLGRFAWHRFLRVYPGYWVVMVVTAFVFAPLAVLRGHGTWNLSDALHFLFVNASTRQVQTDLSEVTWNLSLWTLPVEVECYVLVGLAFLVPAFRRPWGAAAALVLLSAGELAGSGVASEDLRQLFHLGAPFAAGVLLRLLSERLHLQRLWVILAILWCVIAIAVGHLYAFGSLPLAYLVLAAGATMPARRMVDISYGVYIYAFPLQKILSNAGGQTWPVPVFAAVTAVIVAPVAYASARLVERPALRLRSWTPGPPTFLGKSELRGRDTSLVGPST